MTQKNKGGGKLPTDGYFEIRFESIGGLGAHAAGQILGETEVTKMGYNGAHFSSYGSEKKGSVVRSFIRICPGEMPLRKNSPIEEPDVIVVFHAALLALPVTMAGLKAKGTLIYSAAPDLKVPELTRLPKTARAIRVDATKIAVEEKSRPNAVLLGTLSSVFPFLGHEEVHEMLNEEFAGRHPEAVAANDRAFNRGSKEWEEVPSPGKATGDLPTARPTPVWGYKTQPQGGVLPTPGNSAWNNLAMSRTGFMPVWDVDKCIHCAMCDLVCPDMCMVWKTDGSAGVPKKSTLQGIDYRYCKGCLRCVESCPTGALTKEVEKPGMADELRVPLFPEVR